MTAVNAHDVIRDDTNRTVLQLHGGEVSVQADGMEVQTIQAIFVHPSEASVMGLRMELFAGSPGIFAMHDDVSDLVKGDPVTVANINYKIKADPMIGAWRGLTGLQLWQQ